MASVEPDTPQSDLARVAERLRLAEAGLSRRRQADCGPSENARAAMRFVFDRSDAGRAPTPSEIAAHLGISAAAVTAILDKLHAGGLVAIRPNPEDGRSKLVEPFDRTADADHIDPLTTRIRDLAAGLTDREAERMALFLEQLVAAVDAECR